MAALHHIALGALHVERVAAFYRDILGLKELVRHTDVQDSQKLRSIWLELGAAVLMIEQSSEDAACHVEGVGCGFFLLAITIQPEDRIALEARLQTHGFPIESRSAYSSYTRDPEGNRVAISHYPHPYD